MLMERSLTVVKKFQGICSSLFVARPSQTVLCHAGVEQIIFSGVVLVFVQKDRISVLSLMPRPVKEPLQPNNTAAQMAGTLLSA